MLMDQGDEQIVGTSAKDDYVSGKTVGQSFFPTLPPNFSFAIPSEFALHSII